MKKFLVILLLSLLIIPNVSFAQGQKKYSIEGTVTLFGTSEPIPYANVLIKELNQWSSTNAQGQFKIPGILPGSYTMEVSSLGYQTVNIPVKITQDYTGFKLQLKEENLTLNDIVVTAKAGTSLNSSSRIDNAAIQHLQATSLADVMQLLPGSLIKNPSLNESNVITIRSISNVSGYNSRGVGILVNGAKISNDATLSSSESYDFRNISTDNIESVEVLKGVVSAEYGDLTSGAIIVKTKTGRTPYEVRVKTDPKTKAVSFSKGISVGKNAGNLNFDVDYARSFANMVSPVNVFDRTTLGVTYSNTFNQNKTPLNFNFRVSGYITGNSITSDPDVSSLDFSKTRNSNLAVALFGNWMLNKSLITSLTYNISGNFSKNSYQNYVVTNQLPMVTTSTLEEGISLGYYTGTLDKRDQRIDERPIYANAKITANLNKMSGDVLFKS
ncbi:MAG: carboxypeptidase-like regulatory domain-containing protein, partial [Thiovulaceae bacterium]|nr:carboxypeptidase-like regulatory domain-containing protein [Sulfurimonadaceae bacterium]